MSAPVFSIDNWTGEYLCHECNYMAFDSWNSLRDHLIDSQYHGWCERCDRDFLAYNALLSHLVNSPHHGFCTLCHTEHDDVQGLQYHEHTQHAVCSECNRVFRDGTGLHEHSRQSHPYCIGCRRVFKSQANLNAHLASALHTPLTVPCRGGGCVRMFVDVSSMVSHLESGTCASGATRHLVDTMVRRADQHTNFITVPQRMLGWSEAAAALPPPTYLATEAAWNYDRQAYECYLCHHLFPKLQSLNSHLASSRHSGSQEKFYRCPSGACRIEYGTVSALVQHIEKGGCGVRKFQQVQERMTALIGGPRAIGW